MFSKLMIDGVDFLHHTWMVCSHRVYCLRNTNMDEKHSELCAISTTCGLVMGAEEHKGGRGECPEI